MPAKAARLNNLPPYVFATIGDRIRQMESQGKRIFRLDIGNPDMPPPDAVVDCLCSAAQDPSNHGYTGYRGKANFRKAIARYYESRFGVSVNPDTEVLPVIGSKEGLINLSLAYLDDGDLALIPDIGYPSYEMGARIAGADTHYIQLDPENDYFPVVDSVSDDTFRRAKLLWINYPNNPTGACIDLEQYRTVVEKCIRHDTLLVSDNPYVDVTFGGQPGYSALQVTDTNAPIVEFVSLSKSYNMAGWRLGAAVGSAEVIRNLLQMKSNVDSGHFGPIYDAGVAALETPQEWIDNRNAIYERRRDKIMGLLPDLGLSAQLPRGSLYVWAKVENGLSARDYVEQALENAQVSLAPGEAYGPGGHGFVRISVGVPDAELDEALERMQVWHSGL